MKRNALCELIQRKASEDRKPLVLKGARQVGKTLIIFDKFLEATDAALYAYCLSIKKAAYRRDIP